MCSALPTPHKAPPLSEIRRVPARAPIAPPHSASCRFLFLLSPRRIDAPGLSPRRVGRVTPSLRNHCTMITTPKPPSTDIATPIKKNRSLKQQYGDRIGICVLDPHRNAVA